MTTRRFCIRINGRLSDGFADVFDGVDQKTVGRSTVLTGTLVDRATLHGVLDYLRRLGIDIEHFETLPATDSSQRQNGSWKESSNER